MDTVASLLADELPAISPDNAGTEAVDATGVARRQGRRHAGVAEAGRRRAGGRREQRAATRQARHHRADAGGLMPGEVDETTKRGVGPEDLRLMQVLARDVTIRKAELVNGDASVGELAWVWGRDLGWLAPYWRHRFRFDEAGDVAAWAWARLPFKLDLPNGEVQESKSAHLTWLTRTNERDRFRDVLGWYDDVAPGSTSSWWCRTRTRRPSR